MASLNTLLVKVRKARQAGARLGRANRAAAGRRRRAEPADHLRGRAAADAQQVLDAIWKEDRVNLNNLALGRTSYRELRQWAEQRWQGSADHRYIFKSADQFFRFVDYMYPISQGRNVYGAP